MSAACPYCRGQFEAGDGMKICPACATPHHKDCFIENGGCTVFGCVNAPGDEPAIRVLLEDLGDNLTPPRAQPLHREPPAAARMETPAPGRGVAAPPLPAAAVPGAAAPGAALPGTTRFGVVLQRVHPAPPNLPWGLLLMLSLVSAGLFQLVWDLTLARWMRIVQPRSRALYYYSAVAVLLLFALAAVAGGRIGELAPAVLCGFGIAVLVLCLMGRFSMRRSLEDYFDQTEAMGLSLGEGMTLFFGSIYFQYHLNRTIRHGHERAQAIA